MSIRWLIWSLLSPSQILLGLTIAGGLLLAFGRARWGKRLSVAGAIGLLIFGFLPTSHYLAAALETRFPQPRLPEQITGIVLLSGAERPEATEVYGEPQFSSAAGRYTSTLRLAARYPDARIVFSGGPPIDPETGRLRPTGVARRFLESSGIAAERLAFDQDSRDTYLNAQNSKALVQPRPGEIWVVVTSAMHIPRTMASFRAVGWEVIPKPADYQVVLGGINPGTFQIADNLNLLDKALHEWVGLAFYRLSGRTRELFPAPFDPAGTAP